MSELAADGPWACMGSAHRTATRAAVTKNFLTVFSSKWSSPAVVLPNDVAGLLHGENLVESSVVSVELLARPIRIDARDKAVGTWPPALASEAGRGGRDNRAEIFAV